MLIKLDANELWQYSLEQYPQVAALLLPLQDDYQLNINLLLLCGYAQSLGCAIDDLQLQQLLSQTKSWQDNLVSPFRQLRRELKAQLNEQQYQQMLTMELALEKEQQWRLIASLPELPAHNPEAQSNILSCLITSGVALEVLSEDTLTTIFAIGDGPVTH